MSCNDGKKPTVTFDADCKCEMAVMNTYKNLLKSGLPEPRALEAAKIVYGHHHPEDSVEFAALTVERWVSEGHIH